MKKIILALAFFLILSIAFAADSEFVPNPANPDPQTTQNTAILTKLQIDMQQTNASVTEINNKMITASDLNVFQNELLNNVKRVQNQTMMQTLVLLFVFALFIFAVIALAKARGYL